MYDNDCVMKAESCLQQKPISSRPLTACSPGVSQETGVSGVQQQVTGDCTRSRYGCCQDGITPSPGFNFAGCPGSFKLSIIVIVVHFLPISTAKTTIIVDLSPVCVWYRNVSVSSSRFPNGNV